MLSFIIKYVPGRYNTNEICDKTILENGGMLELISDHNKNQKIGDEAVDSR